MTIVSENNNIDYWNDFYKKVIIEEESTFCTFIKKEINEDLFIIDIGCGSGRDTHSFAKEGHQVYGIDRSVEAINMNNDNVKGITNMNFINIDISKEKELHLFIEDVSDTATKNSKKLMIYSRFFLHSINNDTEEILLKVLSKLLKTGDLLVLEFRTIEDEKIDKVYNNHYRRYINADELHRILEKNYGFTSEYFHKGQGLSIYKNEDPYLARIIMKKK